jgi:hypothetical protein
MAKIARVQLADGRVARFEVSDDATPEQAVALAKRLPPGKSQASPAQQPSGLMGLISNVLSTGNEALIGGVEGLYNAASAVTDPIAHGVLSLVASKDRADAALSNARQTRRSLSDAASRTFVQQPNQVARDAGRIAGAMAIPVPKVTALGRFAPIVQRAIQGAVGGAAVRDVDEDPGEPAAIGALVNVVAPPVLSRLAKTKAAQSIVKPLAKAAAPVMDLLGLSAPEAAPIARPLAPLGRKAEARAARFAAAGVQNPTTGMVTRDPNTFSFERNTAPIQGIGEDLQQQIRDVESGLVEKGRELIRAQGGAKGAEATGADVQKALDSKRNEMQQVTGRLYDKIRDERGDEVVGTLDGLRDVLNHPDVTDNAVFDQMRDSLGRRMERLGVPLEGGDGARPVTVKQAEELRKFIGGLGNTADPAVRMMRRNLIDGLDDDVVAAVGDDAFKAARESAKARFAEFSKTFAGRVADEGVAPEQLTKRVLSDTTSLSDLRAMRKSLMSGTDEQVSRGTEAWRGLRAQALNDLLGRSTDGEGKLLGGQLSRDFVKQSAKLRELLEPEDYRQLRRLVLASRDATVAPPGSAVNYSNTAPALANIFQSLKPKVREGWLQLLAKNGMSHVAAWAVAGPSGNLGLWGAKTALDAAAENKVARELLRRVRLARNPEETAAAIAEIQKAAKSNPAAASLFDRLGLAGYGAARGAAAAEAVRK